MRRLLMIGHFQNYENVYEITIDVMSGKVNFQTSLIQTIQILTT